MAPKKNAAAAAPADTPVSTPAKATKAAKAQSSSKSPLAPEQIWSHYWKTTGHQTRLIDAFLAFLMVVGAIQFVYYFLIAKDVRANTIPAPGLTLRGGKTDVWLTYSLSTPSWPASPPPLANSSSLVRIHVPIILIRLELSADVAVAVSLRMQTDEQNKSDFPKVTPERSFADYILGSLILHFFCVNYIN